MKMVVASLTDGRTDREEKKRKGSLKLLQRGGKPPFAPPPLCSLFCPTDNFLPLLFPFSALAAVGERWRCGKIKIAAIWQRGLTCSLFVPNRLLRLRWNFFYDMALSTISSSPLPFFLLPSLLACPDGMWEMRLSIFGILLSPSFLRGGPGKNKRRNIRGATGEKQNVALSLPSPLFLASLVKWVPFPLLPPTSKVAFPSFPAAFLPVARFDAHPSEHQRRRLHFKGGKGIALRFPYLFFSISWRRDVRMSQRGLKGREDG